MDNCQAFVDQYPDRYKGAARKVVDFMNGRATASLMGDDLYELFGKTIISKTKFYLLRSMLIDFIDYKNFPGKDKIINRISRVSQAQWARRMDGNVSAYSSLDELLGLLQQIAIEGKINPVDITPLQSMAIMVWFDYTNDDIIKFKISDIDAAGKIEEKYKEILKTYANLHHFQALPGGRTQYLVDSEYLFRTANTDQLTDDDVRKTISKINSLVSKKGKAFTRVFLSRSKAFVDIYKAHKLNVSEETIRNYFGKTKGKAEVNILIAEYKKWVEQL